MRRLGENGWEALSLAGLLSLLVIDYILSYIGITLGVAYELIPLVAMAIPPAVSGRTVGPRPVCLDHTRAPGASQVSTSASVS